MTPDVIGVIVAAFGGAATLLGGTWGMLAHNTKKIEAQIAEVKNELVEVKIGLARLEGPQHRLIHGRG